MSTPDNNFSSRERKLIILLSAVALFIIGVLIVPHSADKAIREKETAVYGERSRKEEQKESAEYKLRPFDPNTIDSVSLTEMGIGGRKIRNLLNYRRSGAVFRSADDLNKLYTWESTDVERLAPYIRIEEKHSPKKSPEKNKGQYGKANTYLYIYNRELKDSATHKREFRSNKFKSLTLVDLNNADSVTLCSIPGIGATISNIILRRRKLLGGFYSVKQLLECKYVTEDMTRWFKVEEKPQLRQIHINTDSFPDILRHPYINKEQTKGIMKHRLIYGKIQSAEVLRNTNIFKDEELEIILPYLSFE